jgi:hypothetical protein
MLWTAPDVSAEEASAFMEGLVIQIVADNNQGEDS